MRKGFDGQDGSNSLSGVLLISPQKISTKTSASNLFKKPALAVA